MTEARPKKTGSSAKLAAALMAIAFGCDGGDGVVVPGLANRDVEIVVVEPSVAVATEVGQTVDFDAAPFDAGGNLVEAATVVWSSSDPGVAIVNQAGEARVFRDGETEIRATSGAQVGTAMLTVTTTLNPSGAEGQRLR